MKKIICFILIYSFIQATQAQVYELQARTADNACKQMNIRVEQGIAYIQLSDIPADERLVQTVFDLAGLGIQDEAIVIPDDGNKYWFVSFDVLGAAVPNPDARVCVRCECLDRQTGCMPTTRYVTNRYETGCKNYGCNACMLSRVPCGSGKSSGDTIPGSFVIIKANQIIFE